jgi:hypothetical protein
VIHIDLDSFGFGKLKQDSTSRLQANGIRAQTGQSFVWPPAAQKQATGLGLVARIGPPTYYIQCFSTLAAALKGAGRENTLALPKP